jgi:hypothetical protein
MADFSGSDHTRAFMRNPNLRGHMFDVMKLACAVQLPCLDELELYL